MLTLASEAPFAFALVNRPEQPPEYEQVARPHLIVGEMSLCR
jgi:hypothetical protein